MRYTTMIVGTLLVLAPGCAAQDNRNGGTYPKPSYSKQIKEVVKQYVADHPPTTVPTGMPPPVKNIDHPYWGLLQRVSFVEHDRGTPGSQYTAIVADEDDATYYDDPKDAPLPEIVIMQGWLYAVGPAPCVGTTAVVAQAEGTTIVLQCYEQVVGGQKKFYHRVYYLEGDPDKLVWVVRRPVGPQTEWEVPLSVGTFVDAEVDAAVSGQFVQWKGSGTDPAPTIELFTSGDPIYALIRQAILESREEHNVG